MVCLFYWLVVAVCGIGVVCGFGLWLYMVLCSGGVMVFCGSGLWWLFVVVVLVCHDDGGGVCGDGLVMF